MESDTLLNRFLGVDEALELIDSQSVIFLALAMALLWVGKLAYDFCTPYSLSDELTSKDNKAIAVSFTGYMFAICIIVWGILRQDIADPGIEDQGKVFLMDLGGTALWTLFGIVLLQLARIINDKLLLSRFENTKELVEDQNVGTGVVQAGSYIGSALLVGAAIFGDSSGSLIMDIVNTLIYFVFGQVAFILFAIVYQKMSSYDVHDEIEQDNAAAGIGFGMSLTAIGMLLSSYIYKSDSLLGLALWFVIGVFLLSVCRIVVDKLILPGSKLADEIVKDRNWGAALIEGIASVGLALILATLF